MTNIGKQLFLILLFTTLSIVSKGQKNEIGGGLGAFNYRGELAPRVNPLFFRPGGILFFRRNFSPVVSLRLGLSIGGLYGKDSPSSAMARAREAKFNGFLSEASAMLEYNFFKYILSYLERKNVTKFSPYLTGGMAIYNAQISSSDPIFQTESKTKIAIPIGLGIKYMLDGQWNLGVEAVARKTYSDKLDGVSNTIVNNKLVGDTEDDDMYYYIGISISYTFYKVHCPGK